MTEYIKYQIILYDKSIEMFKKWLTVFVVCIPIYFIAIHNINLKMLYMFRFCLMGMPIGGMGGALIAIISSSHNINRYIENKLYEKNLEIIKNKEERDNKNE